MDWTAESVAKALSRGGRGKSRKKGSSWMAPCPAHTDEKPSLHLTDGRKGLIWYCHAGCTQEDVLKAIKATVGGGQVERRDTTSDRRTISYVAKIPTAEQHGAIGIDDFQHHVMGSPSGVWTYRDERGDPIFYVARYDVDGSKEILPWSWQSVDGAPARFVSKAWPDQRPLFNLNKLHAKPFATVIYVEGEKAAQAAEKLFPQCVVTTHQGGAKALSKADLTSLRHRIVVVLPDADMPGEWLYEHLSVDLGSIARRVMRMRWPETWPDGSPYQICIGDDCADHLSRGWTAEMIVEMKDDRRIRFEEADVVRPFGMGDPRPAWGTIEIADGSVNVTVRDEVIGSCGVLTWREVVPAVEREFNQRLAKQHCLPGRFPRFSGSVQFAPFMVGELYDLMRRLDLHDMSTALESWLSATSFSRGNAWHDRERIRKMDMKRSLVA